MSITCGLLCTAKDEFFYEKKYFLFIKGSNILHQDEFSFFIADLILFSVVEPLKKSSVFTPTASDLHNVL